MARPEVELHKIDLNLLVALDALLAEESVTRAAKQVGLSQSAMSHTLRRLRELFGDPLLVRGSGGMKLTPRAQVLIGPVRRGLTELRSALNVETELDLATTRRTFVLGAMDYVQAGLLPRLWARISTAAPGVRIHVRSWAGTVGDLLEAGVMDVAIVPAPQPQPGLMRRELLKEGFVSAVRTGHPILERPAPELDLETYLGLEHILVNPGGEPRGVVDNSLEKLGLERHVAVCVPNALVALHMVARSDLIITCPRALLSGLSEMLHLRTFDPPLELPSWTFKLLWHERYQHDPGHQWLRNEIVIAAEAEQKSSES